MAFGSYEQFCDEILSDRAGPLISNSEDMADELYQAQLEESGNLWDDPTSEEE